MPDGIANRFDAYTSGASVGTPAYTAADERLLSAVLAHPDGALTARAGVRPGPGGAVSVGGTPEAVTVQPFSGIITDPAGGGSYVFTIPAAVSRNIATRPAGGTSRIDELVVRIRNDAARPADGSRQVEVVLFAGSAGADPVAPTVPAGHSRIRRLTVPATGAVSVSLPPPRIAALGGTIIVASQAERDAISPLYDGITVYREDSNAFEDRANGAWRSRGVGPYAEAAGTTTVNGASVTPGGTTTVNVSFPVGRFSVPPIVTAGVAGFVSGSAFCAVRQADTIATTGCRIVVTNFGPSSASFTGLPLSWTARQMTPTTAAG